MTTFATPRGTQDILPEDWPYWDFVLGHCTRIAELFAYRRIETPTFGQTELFARTSGQGTDVVDKEMYSFTDRGGDELTLRPEGTAPIVRAYLQHGMDHLPQPVKLYYVERMFRYARPQRGRYHEHHQFGCEALGVEDAYLDVEMISLLVELYRRLGLLDLTLEVNSIGDRRCRPAYVQALVAYLRQHESDLSPTDRDRLSRNPLRVLDSKDAESQRVIEGAPDILDFLCGDCRAHWDKLRHGLDLLGIAHRVNPHLVRGLDYYNRTVFEFLSPAGGAQAAVNGGGRYDPLSELIGGPPVPGIGFGLGIERVILELMDRNIEVPPSPGPAVYAASVGSGTEDVALQKAYELRQSDIPVAMSFGQRRMKAQLGQADSLGARLAAIVGEDELRDGCITLRQLDTREQRAVPADELAQAVTEDLARTD